MRQHSITQTNPRKSSRRIGRGNGSGRGTTAGRGTKGQKTRTGANSNIPRTFVGGSTSFVQKLPKLKGFKSLATKPVTVNVTRLEGNFTTEEEVTLSLLVEKGIISPREAERGVRVVGSSKPVETKFKFQTEDARLTVSKKLLA